MGGLLKRLFCCCCCCDDNSEDKLLSSRSPKETTPTSNETSPNRELQGISEIRVHRDHDGDEVQEVEVSVQEKGKPDVETPVVLRLKKQASTGEGPSERARVDSGTFVRNSGARLSWRLVPTVTQQAREAAAAKEKAVMEEKRKSAILTSSSNLGDGAIVFSDEAIEEEERHVTLVSEDVGSADTKVGVAVTVLVSQGEISDAPEQVVFTEGAEPVITEHVQDPVEYEEKPDNRPPEVEGQTVSDNDS